MQTNLVISSHNLQFSSKLDPDILPNTRALKTRSSKNLARDEGTVCEENIKLFWE